jgi:hypothetical protein
MGKVIEGKWKEVVPKAKPTAKKEENKTRVYQLRISLIGSKPEIWRRVLVAGKTTLARLHKIIQQLMNWEDDHLHEFVIAGVHYTKPGPDDPAPAQDEKGIHLYEAASREGQLFLYVYDFGDNWEHVVLVEKILEEDPRFAGKPVCLGGENAGTPEDSGGIVGYYEMLKAVKDKRHPEHEEIKEWLGDFNPKAFDLEWVNRVLSRMR